MAQTCRDRIHGQVAWDNASHAGLLLSSYLQDDSPDSKGRLLKAARGAPAKAAGVYQKAFGSWKESLARNSVGEIVEVDGRAVIGLGTESPLETGLTLHHTYGTPFIPGSALKGLASHYCHQVWGERDSGFGQGGAHFLVLFGTTEDSGHIIFNDAWITPESLADCLDMDVMTVHHPRYYQPREPEPPQDFDDPNPIPFLSVKGQFQIFLCCDVPGEVGKSWARLAMALLLEALENWGIGAKTNAGYGRMKRVGKATSKTDAGLNIDHRDQSQITRYGNARVQVGSEASPSQNLRNPLPSAMRTSPTTSSPRQLPCKAGDRVNAILSEEKTKRGGWKAAYEGGGRRWVGPIQNTAAVPASARPGDAVTLIVKSINERDIAFEWPGTK